MAAEPPFCLSRLPPLASLRAFEAAGRHLSFTKAAEELGITTGAISQHIRILEVYARQRLFVRRGRGVDLTSKGRCALEEVQHALTHVARAGAILCGEGPIAAEPPKRDATAWAPTAAAVALDSDEEGS